MEKLLTLHELSVYLGIKEEKLVELNDKGVISGYEIGGEFLRFRRDQIDAIRPEIDSKVTEADKISQQDQPIERKDTFKSAKEAQNDSFVDKLTDFIYFKDFYIISAVIIGFLLMIILKGIL